MEVKWHMRWTAESLSLFLCFTSVEAEVAGSADAPRRRWWQHHASVFSPSICQCLQKSHLPLSEESTHPPFKLRLCLKSEHNENVGQSALQSERECRKQRERWREVENESVGLSSSVQQPQLTDTENTFQTEGESTGEGPPAGAATPPSSQSQRSLLAVMSLTH